MKKLEKKGAQRRVAIVGKAAIYTRVSSNKQAENGASLDVQLEACRRYCEDLGLDIVAEFKDVESGLHNGRHQYQQALDLAKGRGIDKLVVWRLDRLGRDLAEYATQLKAMKRAGVDVISVTQPTESNMMMGIFGVLAEEESRQIAARVTASKQKRAKEGFWGSEAPFGYDTEKVEGGGSILVPNKDAPLVTEMFLRYASGKHSIRDLRDFLKTHGIARSRPAIWSTLKSPTYKGMVRYGKYAHSPFQAKPETSEVKGKHEPLTTPETYERVQERLATNLNRNRGGPRPKFLFSGLIRCGSCGARMAGVNKYDRKRELPWSAYRCNRRMDIGDCKGHSISDSRVRAAVLPPSRLSWKPSQRPM